MSTPKAVAAVLLSGALLGGCGSANGTDDRNGAASDDGADVDGRTFLSTRVTADGEPYTLVPGSRIRLSFGDGAFSAHAGCNQMSGGVRVDGDHLVSTGVVATTEMACDEPLMEQDVWLADALASAQLTLDGDVLTFETPDGIAIELEDREVADPDRPLTGTRWRLYGIVDGAGPDAAVSRVPEGVNSTLRITRAGRLDLAAGCNSGGGSVDIGDGVLRLGPVAMTVMGCTGEPMRVERAVLAVAEGGDVSYSIDSSQLTLTAGDHGLVYGAR